VERPQWHHIIHYRKLHEATPVHKIFRYKQMGLVALMGADPHRELHSNTPGVPPLDIFAQQRVASIYKPTTDVLLNMELYMRAIEQAMASPKSHSIERQVASLAIHAVDLQRPFVREGLILPE
jgi:hypothetical protein